LSLRVVGQVERLLAAAEVRVDFVQARGLALPLEQITPLQSVAAVRQLVVLLKTET
jgi:hypothetical protein